MEKKDKQEQEPFVAGRGQIDEAFPEELQQVVQWYAAQPVPEPAPEFTRRLLIRLQEEEVAVNRVSFQRSRQPIRQTLRMARWQLMLLGPWFWITSMLLLFLGGSMAPFLPQGEVIGLLVYALPLTAVLSAVYTLRRVRP